MLMANPTRNVHFASKMEISDLIDFVTFAKSKDEKKVSIVFVIFWPQILQEDH